MLLCVLEQLGSEHVFSTFSLVVAEISAFLSACAGELVTDVVCAAWLFGVVVGGVVDADVVVAVDVAADVAVGFAVVVVGAAVVVADAGGVLTCVASL